CMGDLHAGRIPERDLYRLLLQVPITLSARELARRFPDRFAEAARACFGTEDPERVPDVPLRGAAMYGLARVDRGGIMPALLEAGTPATMSDFGRLMSITHDGDRLFAPTGGESHTGAADSGKNREYTGSRERLSDDYLREALAAVEAGEPRRLREEPGFYGASTAELDRMVDVAQRVEGVLGAGLMGAGGGGYILILARTGAFDGVRRALLREYYEPLGLEPDVEPWHPTAAAGRLV
ncbi:MAG TPA: hypothetical protein VFU47_00170, partial [Armatimonadota bacterium]|nr:hypothetical protein [Armatimonadota bacterium]